MGQDLNNFYQSHNAKNHNTNECKILKREIADQIEKGFQNNVVTHTNIPDPT